MREAGTGPKTALRLQITGVGLRTRRANSIQSLNFPRSGNSFDAATLVWSNAPTFLLVPKAKLPTWRDLARDAERALDSVPGLIVANWVDGTVHHQGINPFV